MSAPPLTTAKFRWDRLTYSSALGYALLAGGQSIGFVLGELASPVRPLRRHRSVARVGVRRDRAHPRGLRCAGGRSTRPANLDAGRGDHDHAGNRDLLHRSGMAGDTRRSDVGRPRWGVAGRRDACSDQRPSRRALCGSLRCGQRSGRADRRDVQPGRRWGVGAELVVASAVPDPDCADRADPHCGGLAGRRPESSRHTNFTLAHLGDRDVLVPWLHLLNAIFPEMATAVWAATYLKEVGHASGGLAAAMAGAFGVAMFVSRQVVPQVMRVFGAATVSACFIDPGGSVRS